VVELGETCWLPEAGTLPTEGSILTLSAPVTDQDKVADWPGVITAGETVKLLATGGAADGFTVTVTVEVAEP